MMIKIVKAKMGCEGCIYLDKPEEWYSDDADWLTCKHAEECSADPDEEKIFIASDD